MNVLYWAIIFRTPNTYSSSSEDEQGPARKSTKGVTSQTSQSIQGSLANDKTLPTPPKRLSVVKAGNPSSTTPTISSQVPAVSSPPNVEKSASKSPSRQSLPQSPQSQEMVSNQTICKIILQAKFHL